MQVLNLLAPDQFDTTWLSKVSDVGDNKRLKLNNLRKVLTGTLDYLKDVVGMQLSQFPLPDINKVSQCTDQCPYSILLDSLLQE